MEKRDGMADLTMKKESYHSNCSVMKSTAVFPCKALEIVLQYHSPTAVRLTLQAKRAEASIKTDIHNLCFMNHGALKFQSISLRLKRDTAGYEDILSNDSQEIHWIRVRQQDPDTLLWSMCEIRFFSSDKGAHTSVCMEWLYSDISLNDEKQENNTKDNI